MNPWTAPLESEDRAILFRISDDTLAWCVRAHDKPFAFAAYTPGPALLQPFATFVTLLMDGSLRGCIGTLTADRPLFRSIHDHTRMAALEDPRFPAVTPEELSGIDVKLSILSPCFPVQDPESLQLGVHGIILEKDGYRAVFLPEVATEQGWTREQTLRALSRKAGLAPDAWGRGARLSVFFSEVLVRPPQPPGDPVS